MEVIFDMLNDFKDNAVFVDDSEDSALKEAGFPQENKDVLHLFHSSG